MSVQVTALVHVSWTLSQQFTQIIQLRALRLLQKGSPGYFITVIFISMLCLESPVYSEYPAKVKLPGAKQINPLDTEITVRGCRSQAGEDEGTGRAVPSKSDVLLPLHSDRRRLQKA